jgi:hypothetical protein
MTPQPEYKTREDGSIDTAYYIARGRRIRSAAAFQVFGKLRSALKRAFKPAAKPRLAPRASAGLILRPGRA